MVGDIKGGASCMQNRLRENEVKLVPLATKGTKAFGTNHNEGRKKSVTQEETTRWRQSNTQSLPK